MQNRYSLRPRKPIETEKVTEGEGLVLSKRKRTQPKASKGNKHRKAASTSLIEAKNIALAWEEVACSPLAAGKAKIWLTEEESSTNENLPRAGPEELIEFPSFDALAMPISTLHTICFQIFEKLGLVDHFKLPARKLKAFFKQISSQYKANPYHNFPHAVTVLHGVYQMISTSSFVKEHLNQIDILSMVVAAIGHDLGHFAVSNQFLINSKHELAVLYNDESVLENFHASGLFQVLLQTQFNFIQGFSAEDYKSFRRKVIAAIISTDMKYHARVLKEIQTLGEEFEQKRAEDQSVGELTEEQKQSLMNAIVHSSDISNPFLDSVESEKWSKLIATEMNIQGEEEKRIGLEVSTTISNEFEDLAKLNQGSHSSSLPSPQQSHSKLCV